jgi:hypothetical protein
MTRLGTPLKDGDVNRDVLKLLRRQVGIPEGTLYAFRHGRGEQDAGAGSKRIILTEVGHTTLRMTPALHPLHAEQRDATAEKLAS